MMRRFALVVTAVALWAQGPRSAAAPAAFPGAEGFGTGTVHARGRPVFHVTRLDDDDKAQSTRYLQPGQLRYALAEAEAAGGGYIVFDVAGTIVLKRTAVVPSHTYLAGQSAPGTGVAIEGATVLIGSAKAPVHDVVIRHLRHRGRGPKGTDAFNIEGEGTRNVVLDHVSVSFFRDGAVDVVNGATDVTLQWSHFGDAADSGTYEAYHGEPHLLRTHVNRMSIHHNFYTHAHSRVPWADDSAGDAGFLLEFSHNVVYNFRKYPSDLDVPRGRANFVGNFYVAGRNTHAGLRPAIIGSNGFTVHVRDNRFVGGMGHDDSGAASKGTDHDVLRGNDAAVEGSRPDGARPETDIMGTPAALGPAPGIFDYASARFDDMPPLTWTPVEQNVDQVLSLFGALPRDRTDQRLVQELATRTGEWTLEIPADGNVYEGTPRPDADRDGIPDAWEEAHGRDLTPNGRDLDPDYDNIEVYLNARADEFALSAPRLQVHDTLRAAGARAAPRP